MIRMEEIQYTIYLTKLFFGSYTHTNIYKQLSRASAESTHISYLVYFKAI